MSDNNEDSGITNDRDREREVEVQQHEPHRDDDQNPVEDLKCFVGGLDYALDSETLKKEFDEYGALTAIVMKDKFSGISRGFGFVSFPDEASRDRAIENKKDIFGRHCTVIKALPQSQTASALATDAQARGEIRGRPFPRDRPPFRGKGGPDRSRFYSRDSDRYDRPPRDRGDYPAPRPDYKSKYGREDTRRYDPAPLSYGFGDRDRGRHEPYTPASAMYPHRERSPPRPRSSGFRHGDRDRYNNDRYNGVGGGDYDRAFDKKDSAPYFRTAPPRQPIEGNRHYDGGYDRGAYDRVNTTAPAAGYGGDRDDRGYDRSDRVPYTRGTTTTTATANTGGGYDRGNRGGGGGGYYTTTNTNTTRDDAPPPPPYQRNGYGSGSGSGGGGGGGYQERRESSRYHPYEREGLPPSQQQRGYGNSRGGYRVNE